MGYHIRQAYGGWILQIGEDEDGPEEVYTEGTGLVLRLNEIITASESETTAGNAANKAIKSKIKANEKRLKLDG